MGEPGLNSQVVPDDWSAYRASVVLNERTNFGATGPTVKELERG